MINVRCCMSSHEKHRPNEPVIMSIAHELLEDGLHLMIAAVFEAGGT